MKTIRRATIFVALLLYVGIASAGAATHIVAKQIPFFYQLPSNEIWTIYQDKEGFMWVGTTGGMARYDGYQLQSFRNDYRTPHLLTNNSIVTFTDNDRYVWIGTHGGLNMFDKSTWRISPCVESSLQGKNIDALVTGEQRSIWVGSEGCIYHLDATGKLLHRYILSKCLGIRRNIDINSIYRDWEGTLWAMLGNSGMARYDRKSDTFRSVAGTSSLCCFTMVQDHAGRYWIGTWGNGLWEYDPVHGKGLCRHEVTDDEGNEYKAIFSVVEDDNNHYLWLLSYSGAFCLERQSDGSLRKIDLKGIVDTYKMYTRIFKDREGNLWLSSYDKAYIISFDKRSIDGYPLLQLKMRLGYDANIINMYRDRDGILWLSQDRFGLCLYNASSDVLSFVNKNGAGATYEVGIIRPSKRPNCVWVSEIGKDKTRIMQLMRAGMQVKVMEELDVSPIMEPEAVNNLCEDAEGNLWVLTGRALGCRAAYNGKFLTTVKDVPTAITMDNNGNVWAVGRNGQIERLTISGGSMVRANIGLRAQLSNGEKALHLCVDNAGGFWMSTTLANIFHGVSESRNMQCVNMGGLTDGCTILKLLPSGNFLWIVTNNKLIRYNLFDHLWKSFFTSDEHVFVDLFRGGAAVSDGAGGIFAGGHNGVVHIGAQKDEPHHAACFEPLVTDVKVNGKSVFFDGIGRNDNSSQKVFLNPDDRNVEIYVSALEYCSSAKHTIAYRLEGFDKEWTILPPDKHSASYNELKKGSYKFRLRYLNDDGQWVECTTNFQLVRLPALYETWYAYVLYTLMIGALLWYGGKRYLRRQARRNDAHLKREVAMARLNGLAEEDDDDKNFLREMMRNIEENIDRSDYDVEQMARKMNVSKSTLHRRVKALCGLTPFELIRSIKMKKATEMLMTGHRSISEIAYSLGFNNPKYFTKCFKDEYNETPTHYQQKHSEGV